MAALLAHRELLWLWTQRTVRSRYKQTLLGFAWAVVQPVSMMLMFTLVFHVFVGIDTGSIPYPLFSFAALVPWTFFSSSVTSATTSLAENMSLVTKVYFPREILPLSAIGARAVDFAIAWLVFLGLMAWYRWLPTAEWLWVVPLFTVQLALTIGLSLLFSALDVFYRDIRHVVVLGMQLWLYLTPVIYPIAQYVPEDWRWLYALNPMAGIIEGYRAALLTGSAPPMDLLAVSAIVSFSVLVVGWAAFRMLEWRFVDIV